MTTGVALVFAVAALVATFVVSPVAAAIPAGIPVVALGHSWLFSRHLLAANAPEQEFAAIAQAEAKLAGGDT